MTLMGIVFRLVPGGARRITLRSQSVRRLGAMTLVIVRIHTTRIIRVVLDLTDVAHEIGSRVDGFEVAESPIDRQGGIFVSILVEGVVEQRDRLLRQRRTI